MNASRIAVVSFIFIFVANSHPVAAMAQAPDKAEPVETSQTTSLRTLPRDVIEDFKHLPSRESLGMFGVGGALALSVQPADTSVNSSLSDDQVVNSRKSRNLRENSGTASDNGSHKPNRTL